jgi:hypothetical protein
VCAQYIRFVAAEIVTYENKSRAISLVFVGSAILGSIGPQLVSVMQRKDQTGAEEYSNYYLAAGGLAVVFLVLVNMVNMPKPVGGDEDSDAEDEARRKSQAEKIAFLHKDGEKKNGNSVTRIGKFNSDPTSYGIAASRASRSMSVEALTTAGASRLSGKSTQGKDACFNVSMPSVMIDPDFAITVPREKSDDHEGVTEMHEGLGISVRSSSNGGRSSSGERSDQNNSSSSSSSSSSNAGSPRQARPLCAILCTPIILVSILSATTAMFVMTLVMSASTLAMRDHFGYQILFATSCIQLHIVCMFFPGLFTGSLMNSIGKLNTIFLGNILLGISLTIGLLGHSKFHFIGVLGFLGVSARDTSCRFLQCSRPPLPSRMLHLSPPPTTTTTSSANVF